MIRAKIIGRIDLSANASANATVAKKRKRYVQKPLTRTFASILAPALREYRERMSDHPGERHASSS